jgi:hypothetical protein
MLSICMSLFDCHATNWPSFGSKPSGAEKNNKENLKTHAYTSEEEIKNLKTRIDKIEKRIASSSAFIVHKAVNESPHPEETKEQKTLDSLKRELKLKERALEGFNRVKQKLKEGALEGFNRV